MSSSTVLVALLGLTLLAFALGRWRPAAAGSAGGFHSLPGYYGGYVAIWCALPALLLYCLWQLAEPGLIRGQVLAALPAETLALPEAELGLVFNDIQNLVAGNIVFRGTGRSDRCGGGALCGAAAHQRSESCGGRARSWVGDPGLGLQASAA